MRARLKGRAGEAPETDEGDEALFYSIGDLAGEFAISTRTIRFYEAKGLIAPRRAGTTRIYSRRDRARLILILRGKRLGFSLEEVSEYLDLYDADPHQLAQTRLLLQKVETAIGDLELKQADIKKTLSELRELRGLAIRQLKGGGRNSPE